ncbi:hypothetical protein HK101_005794 [Irineochytrium annulatum]|nr:hypothetical protein HK101_005794 [Irineochytrium annulatum]
MKNLAIYYGWLSALNSSSLHSSVPLIASHLSQFDHVVLGAGLQSPTHPDHGNTVQIISSAVAMKPSMLFWGYVTIGAASGVSMDDLRSQIQAWKDVGAGGVFVDEAGFDYATDRVQCRRRQIGVAIMAHGLGMPVAYNAWDPDDLVGRLPGYNGGEEEGEIPWREGDALLYESYVFTAADVPKIGVRVGTETFEQYRTHVGKLTAARERYGVAIWGVPTTRMSSADFVQAEWNFLCHAALVDGFDAVGWGHSQFSASGPENGVLLHREVSVRAQRVGEIAVYDLERKLLATTDLGDLLLDFNAKHFTLG